MNELDIESLEVSGRPISERDKTKKSRGKSSYEEVEAWEARIRRQEEEYFSNPHAYQKFDNPLDIPPHIIPPQVEYTWIRTDVYNNPSERFSQATRIGYHPVPASRHPELMMSGNYMTDKYQGNIYYKGVMLCEISKRVYNDIVRRRQIDMEQALGDMPGIEFSGRGFHPMGADMGARSNYRRVHVESPEF